MRAATLCFLVAASCAQILGLDSPTALQTGDAAGSGKDSPTVTRCRGDSFDDNLIDVAQWDVFAEVATQLVETGKHLELQLDDSSGSAYGGIDAKTALADDDTGVQLEIVQPSGSDATEVALVLQLSAANQLVFGKDNLNLSAKVRSTSGNSSHDAVWMSGPHRFLRIERSRADSTVTFSTSADGATWSVLWSTMVPFASQRLTPEIYAGHYMQVPAQTVIVDNFSVLTANCTP
jgi:hypothetical protein